MFRRPCLFRYNVVKYVLCDIKDKDKSWLMMRLFGFDFDSVAVVLFDFVFLWSFRCLDFD